jgi:hypothetical protein
MSLFCILTTWPCETNLGYGVGYVSVTVSAIFEPRPGRTGAHTNTIEATWKHVNVFLNAYNRQINYIYYLILYSPCILYKLKLKLKPTCIKLVLISILIYIYYLSECLFASVCRARAIGPFTMFLHVIPVP